MCRESGRRHVYIYICTHTYIHTYMHADNTTKALPSPEGAEASWGGGVVGIFGRRIGLVSGHTVLARILHVVITKLDFHADCGGIVQRCRQLHGLWALVSPVMGFES